MSKEYIELPTPASQEMMDNVAAWVEEVEDTQEDALAALVGRARVF